MHSVGSIIVVYLPENCCNQTETSRISTRTRCIVSSQLYVPIEVHMIATVQPQRYTTEGILRNSAALTRQRLPAENGLIIPCQNFT